MIVFIIPSHVAVEIVHGNGSLLVEPLLSTTHHVLNSPTNVCCYHKARLSATFQTDQGIIATSRCVQEDFIDWHIFINNECRQSVTSMMKLVSGYSD
mmetsp:Transcript_8381/g.20172  ORF Transcript_8381/g.20172 Transcript_8381/m.20172 type:complete len:97 (+) Transcript_8381:242-532(+)